MRDGTAVLTIQNPDYIVKYKGEYLNDKRHGKCEELSY